MRRQLYEVQRAMRARRETALRRGVIAVLDIGTSKVACLVLQFVPEDGAVAGVAYADLVLPDTTYLERHDCISLLDRPISEPDAAGDAIRWPVIAQDRDVRPFQSVLVDLGLGYLSLGRVTTTLSPGEMQRLRLATQLRSGLFGVVYVLDEPSAGLHPADAEPLLEVLEQLRDSGNSVFVVEHDMDAVFTLADRVSVLVYGRVIFTGTVAEVRAHPDVRAAYLGGDAPC